MKNESQTDQITIGIPQAGQTPPSTERPPSEPPKASRTCLTIVIVVVAVVVCAAIIIPLAVIYGKGSDSSSGSSDRPYVLTATVGRFASTSTESATGVKDLSAAAKISDLNFTVLVEKAGSSSATFFVILERMTTRSENANDASTIDVLPYEALSVGSGPSTSGTSESELKSAIPILRFTLNGRSFASLQVPASASEEYVQAALGVVSNNLDAILDFLSNPSYYLLKPQQNDKTSTYGESSDRDQLTIARKSRLTLWNYTTEQPPLTTALSDFFGTLNKRDLMQRNTTTRLLATQEQHVFTMWGYRFGYIATTSSGLNKTDMGSMMSQSYVPTYVPLVKPASGVAGPANVQGNGNIVGYATPGSDFVYSGHFPTPTIKVDQSGLNINTNPVSVTGTISTSCAISGTFNVHHNVASNSEMGINVAFGLNVLSVCTCDVTTTRQYIECKVTTDPIQVKYTAYSKTTKIQETLKVYATFQQIKLRWSQLSTVPVNVAEQVTGTFTIGEKKVETVIVSQ